MGCLPKHLSPMLVGAPVVPVRQLTFQVASRPYFSWYPFPSDLSQRLGTHGFLTPSEIGAYHVPIHVCSAQRTAHVSHHPTNLASFLRQQSARRRRDAP